ncbi:hypothetical protein [Parashewanella tropica]|uniref:hypothetical protein n=1 Tax=Parashewanella tropica TaxID=2547970 RepID=UPI001059EBAC|nr:hypothetical protein [Parashewanella tropica]
MSAQLSFASPPRQNQSDNQLTTYLAFKACIFMVKSPSMIFTYLPIGLGSTALATFSHGVNVSATREQFNEVTWKVIQCLNNHAQVALHFLLPFKIELLV